MEVTWSARLGPPLAALAGLTILAASVATAGPAWRTIEACPDGSGPAAAPRIPPASRTGDGAWFRLDPVLDAAGTISGRRLEIGVGRARGALALPAESSAAGPQSGAVLVATDDGRASTVTRVDLARLCSVVLGTTTDVVRRAILSPAGDAIHEYRVDRASRASLGVWRRPLDGTPPSRILGPIGADPADGPTFSTELSWSVEGDVLAVQSCGPVRCTTRLVDPGDGSVVTVDGPDHGELVGVAGGLVVTYAPCGGLPCPIVATDARIGARTVLAEAAGLARLVATPDGPRLVHEVRAPGSGSIRAVRLDGSGGSVTSFVARGLLLAPGTARSVAGADLPPGWVLLSVDGRPGPAEPGRRLLHPADGRTADLDEVLR